MKRSITKHNDRYVWLLIAMVLITLMCSCRTATVKCRHIAPAQFYALSEQFDEVQLVHLKPNKPGPQLHAQVRARNHGKPWLYLDNHWLNYSASSSHRAGFTIIGTYTNVQKFVNRTKQEKE